MALIPHTVDIVVAEMPRALAFYRLLGLAIRRKRMARAR